MPGGRVPVIFELLFGVIKNRLQLIGIRDQN